MKTHGHTDSGMGLSVFKDQITTVSLILSIIWAINFTRCLAIRHLYYSDWAAEGFPAISVGSEFAVLAVT